MIRIEHQDRVAIVKLDRGVINAINLELLEALDQALDAVRTDGSAGALVLTTANEKFFSIGFDIPALIKLDQKDMRAFFSRFNRTCMNLFLFPKPTVAAIAAHAVAGGCILALCCDYRFIAEGRRLMGLNEILLGVPVPYLPDRILHSLAGDRHARDIMFTGELFRPEEMKEMGVVDEILPLERLLPRAIEKAGMLGALPGPAFGRIKQNHTQRIEDEVRSRLQEKEAMFIEHWFSPEAQELLRKAMEKF